MTSRPSPIERLRQSIDCLPTRTRDAMLDGLRRNDIIVGAYTSDDGICPMLAAHRCGGRTDLLSFARAWDRFTGAGGRPRPATRRELGVLRSQLEASLMADERIDLGAAIAEHRTHRTRRARSPVAARAGDPDRSRELRDRPGWAWMRPLRRLDEYERALERLSRADRELIEA